MRNIMPSEIEMPKYKCHKEVWALKIRRVKQQDPHDGSAFLEIADDGYAPIFVDKEYMDKHKPESGGYYVLYKGGYESFSPAAAFESGYTRL
jgi:hypothetical protein